MKKLLLVFTILFLGNAFCKASSINDIIKYCRSNIELNTSLGNFISTYNVPDETYYATIDGNIFEISYLYIDKNSNKKDSYAHKARIDLSKALIYGTKGTNNYGGSHNEYEIWIYTFGNYVNRDASNNSNSNKYSNTTYFFRIGCKDLSTQNQILAPLQAATKQYRVTYSNTDQGCRQAYSQLFSSFTDYKIKTENAKKIDCATTAIKSISYKNGYLTINLNDKSVNCWGGGFVAGQYSLKIKLSDLSFSIIGWADKSTLYLCSNNDGIEIKTPSGTEIITKYGFEGKNMVMEKIYKALASFQDVVLESGYSGTLGGGSSASTSNQSTNSNKSESKTKKIGKYVQ